MTRLCYSSSEAISVQCKLCDITYMCVVDGCQLSSVVLFSQVFRTYGGVLLHSFRPLRLA